MTFDFAQYVQERDEAVRAAVMEDDLEGLAQFCRRYGVDLFPDRTVMLAGACKTVCMMDRPPADVLAKAKATLAELGMSENCWTIGRGEQTEDAP